MTSDLESEILALRSKKLTSKQIARKLALKISQVNSAIKASAQKDALAKADSNELPPVAQCLVNNKCVELLLQNKGDKKDRFGGLGIVLVSRDIGYERFVVCTYMVDYWCLGLKDTIGEKKLNGIKYQQFRNKVYQGFSGEYQEISLKQAQAIVFGAIAYAESLGFKPHRDFRKTKKHLGIWDGQPQLTFGRDGKPFFIEGPCQHPAIN